MIQMKNELQRNVQIPTEWEQASSACSKTYEIEVKKSLTQTNNPNHHYALLQA